MKRWLPVLSLMLLLVGCGFKDIDKRFFITAMGVDKSDNPQKPYCVTIKLVITSPQIQPGKENFQILSENGETISEAVHLLKSKVDKELDFSHTKVVLFGESIAQKNINEILDWFDRRRDIQKIAYLAMATPSAKSVLKVKVKSERFAGNALILSFANSGTDSSYRMTEYLFDFKHRLEEKGLDPFLPVIQPITNTYIIQQTALFNKQNLITKLDANETRLINELMWNYSKVAIKFVYKKIKYSMTVDSTKTSYTIQTPIHQTPYIDMHVNLKGLVEESTQAITDQNWDAFETAAEKVLEKRYVALLTKLQKMNVDPIGFGLHYQATRFHKDQDWTDWIKIYPKLKFHVHVNVNINGSGIVH